MRKKNREVTNPADIFSIMQACDRAVLAFNAEPAPYLLPVNMGSTFTEDGFTLYFHGATEGCKYAYLRDGAPVSFEMDCHHELIADQARGYCTMDYDAVIGTGRVHEILSPAEKAAALQVIVDSHHVDEAFVYNPAAIPRTRVFKVEVNHITGKSKHSSATS